MRPFRDQPIRQKLTLITVLTSTVVLVLASAAFTAYELISFRRSIFLLSSRLQRTVSTPILHLAHTAKAISQKEDYSIRAKMYGRDEVGLLITAFNDMLNRIQEREGELQQRTAEFQQEAAERQQAETALLKSKEELEETHQRFKENQANMLQAEKMASIGQLAAGVAHEINNPMGFIFSNFSTLEGYVQDLSVLIATYDVLEEYIKKGDAPNIREVRKTIRIQKEELDLDFLLADIDELIQESRQGVERVRQIVENLKDFAQVDHEGKKHTDLNSGIENTLSMVGSEILNKATVTKEYGDLPEVMCYPRELNQALVNVLVNAAQAVEGEGNIIIHTFQENGYACIAVTDDGKGMPPEVKQRIFDPFYTTRDVGEGTGMGLSMTYNIVVDKHGGEIQVDSEEGTGTTFTIKIPA